MKFYIIALLLFRSFKFVQEQLKEKDQGPAAWIATFLLMLAFAIPAYWLFKTNI